MIRRLCLISREFPPDTAWGGIARAVDLEARALASLGVETHVITLAPDGRERSHTLDGVSVHRIAEPAAPPLPGEMPYVRIGLWSQAVADKYWELDEELGFDGVEACDYYAEALHLYRREETPLAVWLHTLMAISWEHPSWELGGGERGWLGLEIAAARSADVLIAPTELIIAETRSHLGERMPPTRLIPYVFDPSRYPEVAPGPPDGALRLLFVGRIEPRKGADLALHALAAARAAGVEAELTLLGRDDHGYRWTLDELRAELGLDAVHFLPETDETGVLAQLHQADCAMLPSRFENGHFAALEALSCGLPVITGERNGLGSWFTPETGLVRIPTDDPVEFGRRAAEALADRDALARAGAAGARRLREVFDPAATARQIVELHDEIASAKRA